MNEVESSTRWGKKRVKLRMFFVLLNVCYRKKFGYFFKKDSSYERIFYRGVVWFDFYFRRIILVIELRLDYKKR